MWRNRWGQVSNSVLINTSKGAIQTTGIIVEKISESSYNISFTTTYSPEQSLKKCSAPAHYMPCDNPQAPACFAFSCPTKPSDATLVFFGPQAPDISMGVMSCFSMGYKLKIDSDYNEALTQGKIHCYSKSTGTGKDVAVSIAQWTKDLPAN